MIGEETRPDWLGYDAHVARQRGFKARKISAPMPIGALAAAFLIGLGLGGGAMAWFATQRRARTVER
jgi:hypothetical protein